jgi:hypothetical protein
MEKVSILLKNKSFKGNFNKGINFMDIKKILMECILVGI